MKLRSRALIVVATAAAVVAPIGGGPASAADVVATVNGTDITLDDFDAMLLSLGAPAAAADAGQVRSILTEEIINVVIVDALEDAGVDPDEGAPDDESFDARSARHRALLSDAGLVDVADRQAAYEESGALEGVMCLGLVAVDEADDDALDALRESLDDGTAFGAASTTAGLSPLAVGQSGPCFALTSIPETLSEPLADAVDEAGIGELSDPVELEGSDYLVYAQPFDDVAVLLTADLANDAVTALLEGADVTVSPRYGRWDAATSSVVALDAP